jgi:hypothetical protein
MTVPPLRPIRNKTVQGVIWLSPLITTQETTSDGGIHRNHGEEVPTFLSQVDYPVFMNPA